MTNPMILSPDRMRELFADGRWWKLSDMAMVAVRRRAVSDEDAVAALRQCNPPAHILNAPTRFLDGTAAVIHRTLKVMLSVGEADKRGGTDVCGVHCPAVYLIHPEQAGGKRAESRYGVRPAALCEAIVAMSPATPDQVVAWLTGRIDYKKARAAILAKRKRWGRGHTSLMQIAAMPADKVLAWVANEMVRDLVRRGHIREQATVHLVAASGSDKLNDGASDAAAESRPAGKTENEVSCGSATFHS